MNQNKKNSFPEYFILNSNIGLYEDENYEFKQFILSNKQDVLKHLKLFMRYLTAFLNSNSGVLLFGINDDGIIKGIKMNNEIKDEMIYQINKMISKFDSHISEENFINYKIFNVFDNENNVIQDLYIIAIFVKIGYPDKIYTTPYVEDEEKDYIVYIKLNGTIRKVTGSNLYKYIKTKMKKYFLNSKFYEN